MECPPDFDCAPPPSDCPPDLPDAAADQLSGQGLWVVPHDSARPPESACARAGAASTEADMGVALAEVDCLCGRLPELSAGRGRDRSVYRNRAQPHLAAPPCAAGGLLLCMTAAMRARGCRCRLNAQVLLDHTVTRFYTFAPGMPSTLAVGAGNEEAALAAGVIVFRADAGCGALSRAQPDAVLHLGRYRTAACRTARPKPRCAARFRTCSPATC